ncbi:MAG TPA: DUF4365 domain-containing protein [Gemmataceae bacterium]|nr:DUF4365 domain-containing protein [Gemmataceae bacterium]
MARQILGPRKQRTRQHVIADQSINYVERFIIDEGHTAQQLERDYGYDLLMFTYDEQGYVEPDYVSIQVKSAESLQPVGGDYVYDVDIRDYNLWMLERVPVILILYDAFAKRGYWQAIQRYFLEDPARQPKAGAKTVRVRVPARQGMNRRAVSAMRELKLEPRGPRLGEQP